MSCLRPIRRGFLILGLLPLVAAALVFAWGHQTGGHAAAQVPAPGLDFSMSVEGESGCSTSHGNAVCYLDPGSSFTVDFFLNGLPSGYSGYSGYDVNITYTGLSTGGDPSTTEWQECGFPAHLAQAGSVRFGCAIGVGADPSTYTGLLSTLDFTCTDAESSGNTITLVHGGQNTSINFNGEPAAEGNGTTEVLTINCGAPPTATSTSAPVGATATALPITGDATGLGGDGTNTGLWVVIGLLMAAAVGATGTVAWRFARGR